MLCGDNNRIDTLWTVILIFNGYLCLPIRTKIVQCAVFSYLCQTACKTVCKGYWHRHIFRCFITGVAKHHSLISCTIVFLPTLFGFQRVINTKCNILGLLINGGQNRTGGSVKAVFCSVISDFQNYISCNAWDIDITAGRNFSHDHDHTGCTAGFTGNSRIRILCQNRIKNSITDLITDFIRMSFRHRFGSKKLFI